MLGRTVSCDGAWSMDVSEHREVGDLITLAGPGHSPWSPDLRGQVVEIHGAPGREVYSVRWSRGHVTHVPASVAASSIRAIARTRRLSAP